MRRSGCLRTPRHGAVAAAAVIATLAGTAVAGLPALSSAAPVSGTASARAHQTSTGMVMPTPAAGTPEIAKSTSAEYVRQMVECGGMMYAVGSFTQIISGGVTDTRDSVFSFSATAPYAVSSWDTVVNGTVNSIALTSDCSHAFIGGSFTEVDGRAADDIAEIRTYANTMVTQWYDGGANGEVDTLQLTTSGHLLVGGQFTSLHHSTADPYFASLSAATAADDGFLHLGVSGHIHYCDPSGKCSETFPTQIYNQQISNPSSTGAQGTLDLVEGVFSTVGGQPRQQVFMINLATDPATLTGWNSVQWNSTENVNTYPSQCMWNEPFYIRSAAWSPDNSTVYIADTGNRPWNVPATSPRTGLCDAAAAFPATQKSVTDEWINYTGCDSLFSVAADGNTVFVAGHPRWSDDSNGCNTLEAGGIPDQGLQGLNPATGALITNPKGTEGVYSMSRANADDMFFTSAGLWIASSNRYGSDVCGQHIDHSGICFLPYPASKPSSGA